MKNVLSIFVTVPVIALLSFLLSSRLSDTSNSSLFCPLYFNGASCGCCYEVSEIKGCISLNNKVYPIVFNYNYCAYGYYIKKEVDI